MTKDNGNERNQENVVSLDRHQEEKMRDEMERDFFEEYRRQEEYHRNAQGRFLAAWKLAVKAAGPRLFYCEADSIEDATDKNQLRPNHESIVRYLGSCSVGEAIFIGTLYTFYNGEAGQEFLDKHVPDFRSLGDLARRLDQDKLEIITTLMLNHEGW